jgi:hypothetical protein
MYCVLSTEYQVHCDFQQENKMKREVLHRWAASAALLVVGVWIGAGIPNSNSAHGETRSTPPPTSFQSGGQLSVPLLKEIAATLHQIDARVAKLEIASQKLQTPGRGGQ